MKQWKNPVMWKLGAQHTEAGNLGGDVDGVVYQLPAPYGKLAGTSGPALNYPHAAP